MSGDFLPSSIRMPMHIFEAWRDSRPDEERWQLIDGVPMMMPPPTLMHQKIASNLERALEARLDVLQNGMVVTHEIGIKLPEVLDYLPEPDVAVFDGNFTQGQVYADRFYLVAEVLSDSESKALVAAKLGFYKGHAANRCVLLIAQDRMHVTVHEHLGEAGWSTREISAPDAELSVPLDRDDLPVGRSVQQNAAWRVRETLPQCHASGMLSLRFAMNARNASSLPWSIGGGS